MARKPGLKEPVPGSSPYLGAEIVYACTHEGALGLDDVLYRRTRIRIEVRDRGAEAASPAASPAEPPHDRWRLSESGRLSTYVQTYDQVLRIVHDHGCRCGLSMR